MEYKDLIKLEDGALLKAKGCGFFGKCDRLFFFNKKYLSDSGYLLGSWLIPLNWIKLPAQNDYIKAIEKIKEDFTKQLDDMRTAYEKTKKASK